MRKSSLILCTPVLLLLACLIFVVSCSSGTSTDTHEFTPVSIHVKTPTPTATTVVVSTSTPVPVQPVLGSDVAAFTAKYGPINNHSVLSSGLYNLSRYPDSNIDKFILMAGLEYGSPYTTRIESITVAASDTGSDGWTKQELEQECNIFLPADSIYKGEVTIAGGDLDRVYQSASLAARFPNAAFTDTDQNIVTAGTFDVQYLVKASGPYSSCSIQVGEAQTR